MDMASGEVVVQTKLSKPGRGPRGQDLKPNTGFVMCWPQEAMKLRLSGAQWEAMLWIAGMMQPGTNIAQLYMAQLAAGVGYQDRSPAARLVRNLVARGALRRVTGEQGVFFVNPHVFWNGKAGERSVSIHIWDHELDPTGEFAPDPADPTE